MCNVSNCMGQYTFKMVYCRNSFITVKPQSDLTIQVKQTIVLAGTQLLQMLSKAMYSLVDPCHKTHRKALVCQSWVEYDQRNLHPVFCRPKICMGTARQSLMKKNI